MTGLSVLIPVYNRPVRTLVQQLLAQAGDWGGPVEICLLDDASPPAARAANRPLGQLPGVRYAELPRNVGRAAIRNRLAAAAQYEWLLMLDNDSLLPDAAFLARYAAALTKASVVVGGIAYLNAPPAAPALRLRWHYARRREALPAVRRQLLPASQLMLNNLLIRADVFRQFGFDETLTRYGHEDSKLGWLLGQRGVAIYHLDNPVLHDGLDPAPVFLRKTRAAVQNLVLLFYKDGLGGESKLLRTALWLRRVGCANGFCWAFRRFLLPHVRANLRSATPKLPYFDALKLYWLLQELPRQAR